MGAREDPELEKERREKISQALKGKKPYEMTEEIREKISENNHWKGKKTPVMKDPEVREKISETLQGHEVKEETREKISQSLKEYYSDPEHKEKVLENLTQYNEEARKKMAETQKERLENPKNHPAWEGGKSFEPYGLDFNKILREEIRKRDNYECQICGKKEEDLDKNLDVHHIDYDKKNNGKDNLISLCHECHMKTNWDREGWIQYFKE